MRTSTEDVREREFRVLDLTGTERPFDQGPKGELLRPDHEALEERGFMTEHPQTPIAARDPGGVTHRITVRLDRPAPHRHRLEALERIVLEQPVDQVAVTFPMKHEVRTVRVLRIGLDRPREKPRDVGMFGPWLSATLADLFRRRSTGTGFCTYFFF
jgi:hypothetical protein